MSCRPLSVRRQNINLAINVHLEAPCALQLPFRVSGGLGPGRWNPFNACATVGICDLSCCPEPNAVPPNITPSSSPGYLTPAVSGAHVWAKCLHHPCLLRGPQHGDKKWEKGGKTGKIGESLAHGGGGGGGWDTPPPWVPLWSLPKAGRKVLSFNPLGTKGAEAKIWLSASNIRRGGGGGPGGGTPPPPSYGARPF